MRAKPGKVLLVGSVPRASAEEVFEICSREIGADIACLPDGEVGERNDYNSFVAYRLLDGHPDFETLAKPHLAEGKREWWHANDLLHNTWKFKIKDGVKVPHFDNLLYADAAIDSYATFRRMRGEGVIPAGVRFQVSLPPPHSAVGMWFHDPEDYERAVPAYLDAMVREVERMVDAIPSDERAIQWDACGETLDIEGNLAWAPKSDPWLRYADEILPISMNIPEDVLLGYHFCYGDIQGHHEMEPEDLGVVVGMANLAAQNSGRRLDWVHMPVPRGRTNEAFFRPLQDLDLGGARVYLGLIHHADGLDGTSRRIDAARKSLDDFGIATECGLGRYEPEILEDLLKIHHAAAGYLG